MASSSALIAPPARPLGRAYAGWLAYAAAWLAAAGVWTLAAAQSGRTTPLNALPFGLVVMGTGALMGVGVWHLTGRVSWRSPRPTFFLAHGITLLVFVSIYSVAYFIPDFATGRGAQAIAAIKQYPVLWWNVLMGCWLYLMIAGISYAIHGERARDREAAAAAEARLLAQQAQLTALRAQLNPHFLFNALHTVSALIPHDPAEADRAIERLGELLRYAMADDELVPLSAEWHFVLDYLAFEQLRLGERLRVVDHLDPAAADRLVPPLLLQPLVENAVRHGVAARPEGGHIHVEARVEGDMTIVRVADDGPGHSARNGSGTGSGEVLDDTTRQGRGLTSVRRRLAAVFGTRADLRIDDDRPDGGYVVSLTIPEYDR